MKAHLAAAVATALTACVLAGCQRDDRDALAVVLSLPEQEVTGAAKATVLVDYSGTGANIVSEGGLPACAFILPGIDGQFTDDHKGGLTIHTSGPRALRGPADIAACRMKAGSKDVTAAELQAKLSLRVTAAEDAAGKPIDIATKNTKAHGSSEQRNEHAIEAAQEEAVKAAAGTAAAASSAASGAAGAASKGGASTGGGQAPGAAASHAGVAAAGASAGGAAAGGAAAAGSAAAATAAAAKTPAKAATATAAAPGTILRNPGGAAGAGNQRAPGNGGGVPNPVTDPSYDGSQGQNTAVPAYNIDLQVTSESRFGALQLEITHLGSSGGFIGRDDAIDCTPLVSAIVAGNNPGERTAKLGLISLQGVRTPAPLLRCGFRTREPLSPAAFLVQVTDASDTNSEVIDPPPTVVISGVSRR